MIEVYLNFNGNAREAANYYAKVFEAPAPYIMNTADMPQEDQAQMPPGAENMVIYANVKTFAGDIMLSDRLPGEAPVLPNDSMWINLSHKDHALLRRSFERLAKDGVIIMPLEPAFFSPLYGQVRDKYSFSWMVMDPGETQG